MVELYTDFLGVLYRMLQIEGWESKTLSSNKNNQLTKMITIVLFSDAGNTQTKVGVVVKNDMFTSESWSMDRVYIFVRLE